MKKCIQGVNIDPGNASWSVYPTRLIISFVIGNFHHSNSCSKITLFITLFSMDAHIFLFHSITFISCLHKLNHFTVYRSCASGQMVQKLNRYSNPNPKLRLSIKQLRKIQANDLMVDKIDKKEPPSAMERIKVHPTKLTVHAIPLAPSLTRLGLASLFVDYVHESYIQTFFRKNFDTRNTRGSDLLAETTNSFM